MQIAKNPIFFSYENVGLTIDVFGQLSFSLDQLRFTFEKIGIPKQNYAGTWNFHHLQPKCHSTVTDSFCTTYKILWRDIKQQT